MKLMTTGRRHAIVLITEGVQLEARDAGGKAATDLADFLQQYFRQQSAPMNQTETRASVLGHLQRGGRPMAFDQILAARFADAAVQAIASNPARSGIVGLQQGQIAVRAFGEGPQDAAAKTLGGLYQLQKDISRRAAADIHLPDRHHVPIPSALLDGSPNVVAASDEYRT
jgi:6-phosphofructokinase